MTALAFLILGAAIGYFVRGMADAAHAADPGGYSSASLVARERRRAYTEGMLAERKRWTEGKL